RLDSEVEKIKVRISQALMEVKVRYQDGTALMSKNQFEGAIQKFESAQEILRWLPYEIHKKEWEERLANQVEAAKKKKAAWERDVSRRQREEARFREIVEEKERKEALKRKVSLLFRNANIQFQKERYVQAEKFADQILNLDPFNKDAKRLKEIALRARHMQATDKNRTTYIEEWQRTFEQMDESVQPQVAVIRYPNIDEWKRIANRKAERAGEGDSGKDREEREIESKLKGLKVTLDFDEATLQEVVDFISTNYNLNVVIDSEVLSARSEEELQVTLNIKNIDLKEALELILDLLDLDYVIKNQVIKITDKTKASGKSIAKVYNVQDLVIKLQDFPGPKIDITAAGEDGDAAGIGLEDVDDGEGTVNFEALKGLIEENIGSGTWEEEGNSIQVRQGNLIVKNNPSVHDDIVSLLEQLRQSTGLLVSIETRFILVRDDFLQDIGVDFRGLGTQVNGATGTANPLPPIQAARDLDDTLFGTAATPLGAGSGDSAGIFFDNNAESN
ncbi:MAG: hypothetical protein QF645_11315, partial [Planctomycetota bacterium]|nr:hypothetical protein [Planctomycetota bacterium]